MSRKENINLVIILIFQPTILYIFIYNSFLLQYLSVKTLLIIL